MKRLLIIFLILSRFDTYAQQDSLPVSYFDYESRSWEDAVFVDKEPILLSTDTFHYEMLDSSFTILQRIFIDTMWYYTEERGLFPVVVDTNVETTSKNQPEAAEVSFIIKEDRIDTIRSKDDPRIILEIDTIPGPHQVSYLSDFFLNITSLKQIAEKLAWSRKLAKDQPDLRFFVQQIDTYKQRGFRNEKMENLIDVVTQAWIIADSPIYLWVYTLSPDGLYYPHFDFTIHLQKN